MATYYTSVKMQAYLSGGWVDLSADWLIEDGAAAEWGTSGNSPLDRMPSIGEMRFTLKNVSGKYYPEGGSPLAGWGYGVKVRMVFTYLAVSYVRFLGYVTKIRLHAGVTTNKDTVQVTALDWIKFAESHPVLSPDIVENKRADEGIQTILNAMPQPPLATELQTGVNTFPVIFDGVGLRTTAYTEFAKLVNSEYGTLALLKDATNGEKLKFFNYDADVAGVLAASITNADIDSVSLSYGENIVNRAVATAYPKRIDTEPQILYSLDKAISIRAGETITFRAKYTDPEGGSRVNAIASSMLTPEEPGVVDPYLMTLLNFNTDLTDETGRHTWSAGEELDSMIWNDVYIDGYGTAYSHNILGPYCVTGGYPNYEINAPSSADFNFGSGAFTIGWYENIINPALGNAAMARDLSIIPPFLLGYPSGKEMRVWFSSNGTSWDIGSARSLGQANVGRWTYYEVSRDDDGWFYCFADGELTDKWYSALAIQSSSLPFTIGRTQSNYTWMAIDMFFIKKGQCLHKSNFVRPSKNMKPTLDGDYLMNSLEDGTGRDLSNFLDITAVYGSEAVTYTLSFPFTPSQPRQTIAYITHLQARGRGVYAYNSIENGETDVTSAEAIGYHEINLDQKYQTSVKFGTTVVNKIVAQEKDPRTQLNSVSFYANRSAASMANFLQRDIHDLIHVTDTARGIDNFYFIQKIKFSVQSPDVVYVTWLVKSALEVDELQPTTPPTTFKGVLGVQDLSLTITLDDVTLTQTYTNAVAVTIDDLMLITTLESITTQAIPAPGGVEGSVQYNSVGGFGGDANLLWDRVSQVLTVNATITSPEETGLRLLGGDSATNGDSDGGAVSILAGSAQTTNSNGGDIFIAPGTGAGSGVDGVIRLGGASDYAEYDITGKLILVGAAKYERHVQIEARVGGNISSQPAADEVGVAGGFRFASSGPQEELHIQWEVPDDWDGGAVQVEIDWLPDSGAMTNPHAVKWTFEYYSVAIGESIIAGTMGTKSVTYNTTTAQNIIVHLPVTLDDANQPLAKQDHVFLRVLRDTGVANDFPGTAFATAFEILYTSNGFPTSN